MTSGKGRLYSPYFNTSDVLVCAGQEVTGREDMYM